MYQHQLVQWMLAALEKTFARDLNGCCWRISPNLIIDPVLGNGTAAISIRGIQMNDVEKSFDPAVAVYQDGIYLATATGALLKCLGMQKELRFLEVLKEQCLVEIQLVVLFTLFDAKPTGELGGKS